MANLDPLSPDDTTVVLVDYAVGFSVLTRSHDLPEHVNNVVGLARTAKLYGAGLVVTNGEPSKPSGPLYPELLDAIEDTPVVARSSGTAFNCLLDDGFRRAVERTGRRGLVVGGIATDGCVPQTVLGGLREGH